MNHQIVLLNELIPPTLPLPMQENQHAHFSDFKDKIVVLYFYPKDNTPGCTLEAKDFRDLYPQFLAAGAIILGVSRDSLTSHQSFSTHCHLPFPLVSDPEGEICRYFDVIKEKSFFGKKFLGIQRSTFLIDKNGVLRRIWRSVKVKGHAEIVLAALKTIKM